MYSNYPDGVTQRMIDEYFGYTDDELEDDNPVKYKITYKVKDKIYSESFTFSDDEEANEFIYALEHDGAKNIKARKVY